MITKLTHNIRITGGEKIHTEARNQKSDTNPENEVTKIHFNFTFFRKPTSKGKKLYQSHKPRKWSANKKEVEGGIQENWKR